MQTSTDVVVEERRQPVGKTEPTEQLKVTGQWLYETFVVADATQVTRMQQIRELVSKGVDAFQLAGACNKMVERARLDDLAAGLPEKKTTPQGKEVKNRGPKQQYAMNVRTIIQQAWGALKFAPEALTSLGYTEQTGFTPMETLAKQALRVRGIDWKGDPLVDREERKLKRENKVVSTVLAQALLNTPRAVGAGESEADWLRRVAESQQEAIQSAREQAEQKAIMGIVDKLFENHEDRALMTIACAIFDRLAERQGIDLEYSTASEEPEQQQQPVVLETATSA